MSKTSLFALLLMTVPTATWADNRYPIEVHALVEGEPVRVYLIRAQPGNAVRFQVHPQYWVKTTFERQPDGLVAASVTLSKMFDGMPALRVGEALAPAQTYHVYLFICKTSSHVAAFGGIAGKIAPALPASGSACTSE